MLQATEIVLGYLTNRVAEYVQVTSHLAHQEEGAMNLGEWIPRIAPVPRQNAIQCEFH